MKLSEKNKMQKLIMTCFWFVFAGCTQHPVSFSPTSTMSMIVSEARAATLTLADPELPRVFLDTTYNPKVTGKTISVGAGGDLQAALDQAQPGDVISLQAGATF